MKTAKIKNPRPVSSYSLQPVVPSPELAYRMLGFCIDHYRKELVNDTIITSRVTRVFKNGNFKTKNTHYFVEKEKDNGRKENQPR